MTSGEILLLLIYKTRNGILLVHCQIKGRFAET